MAGAITFTRVKTESKLIAITRFHSASVVRKVFDIFSLITPCANTITCGVGNDAVISSATLRVASWLSKSAACVVILKPDCEVENSERSWSFAALKRDASLAISAKSYPLATSPRAVS